jgi:deoxyribonuclease (pyrimidine dimer)
VRTIHVQGVKVTRLFARLVASVGTLKKRSPLVTRVNVVPVKELSRLHLIAEYREIARLPALAYAAHKRGESPACHPASYTLGKGHVRFFYSRLGYVMRRFGRLVAEMQRRGYKPSFTQLVVPDLPADWYRDYKPTPQALRINRQRIQERS